MADVAETSEERTEEKKPVNTKLIYETRVRDLSVAEGLRVSHQFVSAFNKHVLQLLEDAWDRCQDNGRQTLRPYDL